MIDLYTPAGIGDIYWILQKLARTVREAGEKLRIHAPPGNGAKFERGKFLEFIDVVESVTPDGIPYPELIKKAQQYTALQPVMYCEANTWLESGQRLEQYMPAFPTEFVLNWQIDDAEVRRASTYLDFSKKNVFIYTSGVANNNSTSTGQWSAKEWRARVEAMRKPGVDLVWLGAHYDADILDGEYNLRALFDRVVIDEPAGVVLSALRLCDAFISYQSGLSCISVVEAVPTLMLYFKKLDKLSQAFHPPNAVYAPVFFDDLPDLAAWVDAQGKRGIAWRKDKKDYTSWVDNNVDQTEADWQKAAWIHDDQYNAIKHLKGHILEIGCGSGQLAARIKNEYTGVDQSFPLLALARRKNPDKTFLVKDVRSLDIDTSPHVCAFGFLKHFALNEWPSVFSLLADHALETLTVEIPIAEEPWEDLRHDFPHSWGTKDYVKSMAKANGLVIKTETKNRSGEVIYHFTRGVAPVG